VSRPRKGGRNIEVVLIMGSPTTFKVAV